MKVTCIAASNMMSSKQENTSYMIAGIVTKVLQEKEAECEILDLRDYDINPCIGCGKCFETKRC